MRVSQMYGLTKGLVCVIAINKSKILANTHIGQSADWVPSNLVNIAIWSTGISVKLGSFEII